MAGDKDMCSAGGTARILRVENGAGSGAETSGTPQAEDGKNEAGTAEHSLGRIQRKSLRQNAGSIQRGSQRQNAERLWQQPAALTLGSGR